MRYIINITFLLLIPLFLSAQAKKIKTSMVISGGVSLGAYEAGYNWAIIKLLNMLNKNSQLVKPQLDSVAGASAGSINALISAVYWCQDKEDDYNSVDNNLFYDTWTDIDIQDLTIHGADKTNNSTLFTRRPLIDKANNILRHMQKPIFKNGCKIPLGIAVTKVHPIEEEFQGITMKNQSFVIPLKVYEKNSKLAIRNIDKKNYNKLNTLHTLSIPALDKDNSVIKDILFASSAFPGAFKQIKLNYIYKGKKGEDYFLDGGVYNNIPLDVALALAPTANNFLFIDPDSMRKFNAKICKNSTVKSFLHCNGNCIAPKYKTENNLKPDRDITSGFLGTNLLPLFKSTQIFRSMKLYETIDRYFRNNKNDNKNRHLILSSRYHPITGNFMWAFGAFLDKNFRQYDYYVGVYDAIYRFAQESQKRGFGKENSLPKQMDRYKNMLNISSSKDAITVYNMLLKAEFCNKIPSKKSNRFTAIYNAFNLKLKDNNRYSFKEFTKFLTKLDTTHIPLNEGSFLAYAKENPKGWYKETAQTFLDRVVTLENQHADEDADYTPVARAVGFSAWLGMSRLTRKSGFELQPLFIPNSNKSFSNFGYKLFPHEIAVDSKNGGFSLGYSLYWYHQWIFFDGIEAKLSYNHGKHINDHLRLDIDPFSNFKKGFSLGAGVSVFGNLQNRPFWDRKSAFGANMYVDYNDIFRLTYVRRFHNRNKNYIYFGVKNLSSLLYWLNR